MTRDLVVEGLEVRSADAALVRGVGLRARAGVPLSLIGETGSGKTLVAEAVMGTLAPDLAARGRIVLEGVAYDAADPGPRRGLWGRGLALLPQEPWLALDALMRGVFQVEEVHRFVRGAGREAALRAALEDLAGLGLQAAARKFPFQLSGGMAQRVALAATRATAAPVLLADEPTKGLDAALRDTVGALLRVQAETGGVLLTITHDIALVRALGGEVAVMLEGEIVEHGPVAQVLDAPRHAYTRRLLAAEPAAWPARLPVATGAPVLQADGIGVTLGGRRVLHDLSLQVREGEWISVTGPSGSGKTTLGNLLLGLRRADAGRVRRAAHLPAIRFQKVYQDPVASFAPRRSLRAALRDVARRHGRPDKAWQALLPALRLSEALLDRRPDQVSGGELQRFALARALLVQPAFLFADEPTSRLDPVSQQETIALMQRACGESGCAVLLVTHDPALAARTADRCLELQAA
ncbi:ABC transporter ATP-binding protein [Rhodovastum atsumiense]|uniref:ABC transporter ATP-binding protein n=1 Tax=Rhodovastum atsumiense TaxID=504468 RepID=A0A5M6IPC0_9PROT|nr:ATP-binding cassette domain-containing protein [Rhodovastum atsumiense]KAA5609408.1 ABC transporter ATP-binding protein [Rhodovastum atsumiense]CAH2601833.1 ABC transporter ATP-binding protein [Rhodovastum atsumiense]